MKKLFALLLSAFLLFSLAACGPDETPDDPDGKPDGGVESPAGDDLEGDPAVPDIDWELPK